MIIDHEADALPQAAGTHAIASGKSGPAFQSASDAIAVRLQAHTGRAILRVLGAIDRRSITELMAYWPTLLDLYRIAITPRPLPVLVRSEYISYAHLAVIVRTAIDEAVSDYPAVHWLAADTAVRAKAYQLALDADAESADCGRPEYLQRNAERLMSFAKGDR